MADIKQIKISNTTYDIKDAKIRVSGANPWTKIATYSTGISFNSNATGLADIVNYTFFGLITSTANNTYGLGLTSIGSWYLGNHSAGAGNENSWTGMIYTWNSWDINSASYICTARLNVVSDTLGTCVFMGRYWTLTSSGVGNITQTYLKEVWGLF